MPLSAPLLLVPGPEPGRTPLGWQFGHGDAFRFVA
jgi:hypothetical protein